MLFFSVIGFGGLHLLTDLKSPEIFCLESCSVLIVISCDLVKRRRASEGRVGGGGADIYSVLWPENFFWSQRTTV